MRRTPRLVLIGECVWKVSEPAYKGFGCLGEPCRFDFPIGLPLDFHILVFPQSEIQIGVFLTEDTGMLKSGG